MPIAACPIAPPLQAIEVLLKNKAFVVKRIGAPANGEENTDSEGGRTGQITWAKSGGCEASWVKAKTIAKWPPMSPASR